MTTTPTTLERQMHHPAPASAVFPLLCPVRESEWIPAWTAEVIHSKSGVSELGAIFKTPDGRIWVVSEYVKPNLIRFSVTLPGLWFCLLTIQLTDAEADTCFARVSYTWYPFNERGEDSIAKWKDASSHHLADWERLLNNHLAPRT